jgi:hypothetical protein
VAETLARSLIRLAVTVGILAAIYLFIVKPVLDTTSNSIDRAFEGGQGVVEQIDEQLDSAGVEDAQIDLPSTKRAQRLLRCIQRAEQDVDRIQRCVNRFG